jgi:putative N6-adenine-specific DNA methylase
MHGLEEILAGELLQLGAVNIKPMRRGVSCEGDLRVLYKINLWSRTALRVLMPVHTFTARSEAEIYNQTLKFEWHKILDSSKTFAIDHVVFSNLYKHSGYVALKTKDAIVDQIRNVTGSRPNVQIQNPDILINLHVANDVVTLSVDSSGEPLNRRGYRIGVHPSPINEVLAAGMLMKAGWTPDTTLIDPMCGSGTIVLEAAMMAKNMAPGLKRETFGFMKWNNFDSDLWKELKSEALAAVVSPRVNILGSDIDMRAVDVAKHSSLEFGLNQEIRIQKCPLKEQRPLTRTGMLVFNPPYGERLKKEDIFSFYKDIAAALKKNFKGYTAWIISSNIPAMRMMGMRSAEKHMLYNGSLECTFNKYIIDDQK